MLNFLKGHHIFSPDILGKTFSDWLEMLWRIAIAIFWIVFSIWYKLIYFSLTLNHAIHRMGNTLNFLIPDVKNKKSFNPILYFIASFPKLFWDFISELISLNYAFNIPFKITLKTIKMGTSPHFFSFSLWIGFKRNLCDGLELHFKNQSSTNLHRLTLSEFAKAFRLSVTPVAY